MSIFKAIANLIKKLKCAISSSCTCTCKAGLDDLDDVADIVPAAANLDNFIHLTKEVEL